MVEGGNARTSEALRINGLTPNLTSCIAFYIEDSASRELNLGRDMVIYARNFQFGCNSAGKKGRHRRECLARGGVFMHLMTFGRKSGTFSGELINSVKISKVLHSLISAFLAKLLKEGSDELAWRQPFLETTYKEFNADIVPRDLGGPQSLVSVAEQFWQRLCTCLSQSSALLSNWTTAD